MYLRPVLKAFSESSLPFQSPTSSLPPGAFVFLRSGRLGFRSISHSESIPSPKSSRAVNSLSTSFIPSSRWVKSVPLSPPSDALGRFQIQVHMAQQEPLTGPSEEPSDSNPVGSSQEDVMVQYIVIRKDLVVGLNWPLGSLISQGCHAAVAAIWLHKDDPVTQQYCAIDNLDKMHKVTLEVKGEAQLRTLAQKLESGGIVHKLWIEQPENYATCLATKPYYKSQVVSYFKKLKLCK